MTTATTWRPGLRFVLAGNSGVGKTSLVQRLRNQGSDEFLQRTEPTIGIEFVTWEQQVSLADTRLVRIQVFDLAGSSRFAPITSKYFKDADAIVLMCDLTSAESFHDLAEYWWKQMERFADLDEEATGAHVRLRAAVIVVANKLDLVARTPTKRAVTRDALQAFVTEYGLTSYVECSILNWSVERDKSPFDAFIQVAAARLPAKRWIAPLPLAAPRATKRHDPLAVRNAPDQNTQTASCCQ